MPDVGRVGEHQVRRYRAAAPCDDSCKVAAHDIKTALGPQVTCGIAEVGIEFDPDGALDPLRTEDGEHGGIEAARPDGGVGETDRAQPAVCDRPDVAGDLDREDVGSGELAKAVPLGGRFPGIERRLNGLSAFFVQVPTSQISPRLGTGTVAMQVVLAEGFEGG